MTKWRELGTTLRLEFVAGTRSDGVTTAIDLNTRRTERHATATSFFISLTSSFLLLLPLLPLLAYLLEL